MSQHNKYNTTTLKSIFILLLLFYSVLEINTTAVTKTTTTTTSSTSSTRTSESESETIKTITKTTSSSANKVDTSKIIIAAINIVDSTEIHGSIQGGTRINILGSGFRTGIIVMIGEKLATIDTSATTSTSIICTLPKLQKRTYEVIVQAQNKDVESICAAKVCKITISPKFTSIIDALISSVISPDGGLLVLGNFTQTTQDINKFNIGDYSCESGTVVQLATANLPSIFRCKINPNVLIGYYNISLYARTPNMDGESINNPSLYNYNSDGELYSLKIIPTIHSISSHKGSDLGAAIKITGEGLKTNIHDKSDDSEVEASLGNHKCKIRESSMRQFYCYLDTKNQTSPISNVNLGGAGLVWSIYNSPNAAYTIDSIKNKPGYPTNSQYVFGVPVAETISLLYLINSRSIFGIYGGESNPETLTVSPYGGVQRMSGCFMPPLTGNYTFYLSGCGVSELWLSNTSMDTSPENLRLIASHQTPKPFRSLFSAKVENDRSEPQSLEANRCYYLEAFSKISTTENHLTVGVTVPSTKKLANSMYPVQKITFSCPVNKALGGYIALSLTNSNEREEVPIVMNSNFLEDIVEEFSKVNIPAKVRAIPNGNYQIVYIIEYTSNRGEQIELKVDNINGTCDGVQNIVIISSEMIQNAAYDQFLFPIPDSMLRTVHKKPQITVKVNGILAICPNSPCDFELSPPEPVVQPRPVTQEPVTQQPTTQQPVTQEPVTQQPATQEPTTQQPATQESVTQEPATQEPTTQEPATQEPVVQPKHCMRSFEISGRELNISFTDISDMNETSKFEIEYAERRCKVTHITNISVICSLNCSLDSQNRPILPAGEYRPRVYYSQYGMLATNETTVVSTVSSPEVYEIYPNRCSIGGGLIVKVKGSRFSNSWKAGDTSVNITVGGLKCKIIKVTLEEIHFIMREQVNLSSPTDMEINVGGMIIHSTSFAYDASITPMIGAISPNSISPVLTSQLTIDGTNFGTNKTALSIRLYNAENSIDCHVNSLIDTQINCSVPGGLTGLYNLEVYIDMVGISMETTPGSSQVMITLKVYNITPNTGSQLGGTLLTITGENFSPTLEQNQVSIGEENTICDVISSTTTQLECLTRPNIDGYTSMKEIAVLSRFQEIATCGNNTCNWTYSDDMTPEINYIYPQQGIKGDLLTLVGLKLNNTNGSDPFVLIGNDQCLIESADDTNIKCRIANNYAKKGLPITVIIPNKGYASLLNGELTFNIQLIVNSTSPKYASQGGTILSIGGYGFDKSARVQVGDRTCEILTQNSTLITCTSGLRLADNTTEKIYVTQGTFNETCDDCSLTTNHSVTPLIEKKTIYTSNIWISKFNFSLQGFNFNIGTETITDTSSSDPSSSSSSALPVSPIAYLVSNFEYPKLRIAGNTIEYNGTDAMIEFTDIPAGSYNITLYVDPYGFAIPVNSTVNTTVIVALNAFMTSTVTGSISGGSQITITGSGFFDQEYLQNNIVKLCGLPCIISSSTPTSITCNTIAFATEAILSDYQIPTDNLVDYTAYGTWYNGAFTKKIVGVDINEILNDGLESTFYEDLYNIGLDFGPDNSIKINRMKIHLYRKLILTSTIIPKLSSDGNDVEQEVVYETDFRKYFDGSYPNYQPVIEGSNDKLNWTLLSQDYLNEGWNTIETDFINPGYRYLRFNTMSQKALKLSELRIYGNIIHKDNNQTCDVQVIVNDQNVTVENYGFEYAALANVSDISPTSGTAAGGTDLTISGSGFGQTVENVKVWIDTIPCDVTSVSDNQIICTTGRALPIDQRPNRLNSELIIFIEGKGYVTNHLKYKYIDKWSSDDTWGGLSAPVDGDTVYVPSGLNLIIDICYIPRLTAIIIEGGLTFNDTCDRELNVDFIFIRGGILQIGTEDVPYTHKFTITLYGNKEGPQLPIFGNKVIGLKEGILDIHGNPRNVTWTLLETSVTINSTDITLVEAVDWQIGETIVIASTSNNLNESEVRVIANISEDHKTITLDSPLVYDHFSGVELYGDQEFEQRAEVGLLSRNIIIQGDSSSTITHCGVHIHIQASADEDSIARISYAEIRQAGQAFQLNRYPLLFQLFSSARISFIRGNSIHDTYNRAISLQGVHRLRIENNVVYNVMGHSIITENAVETNNVIERNLVMNTMPTYSLLVSDLKPAAFWITNPNNIINNNRAVSSAYYGFWFDLPKSPTGIAQTFRVCPNYEKLGSFNNNIAHSNVETGLRIEMLYPMSNPCKFWNINQGRSSLVVTTIENFTSYGSGAFGIWAYQLGHINFIGLKMIHHSSTNIELHQWDELSRIVVNSSLVVGRSTRLAALTLYNSAAGMRVDSGIEVHNVSFHNFFGSMIAFRTGNVPGTIIVGGLSFYNVGKRVSFDSPRRHIFFDLDGSLTGCGYQSTVTPFYMHLFVSGCVMNATYGLICDNSVEIRTVNIYGSLTNINGWTVSPRLVILRLDSSVSIFENDTTKMTSSSGWGSMAFVTGYDYRISWDTGDDFTSLKLKTSRTWTSLDKPVNFIFNFTKIRLDFNVFFSNTTTSYTIRPQASLFTYNYSTGIMALDNTQISTNAIIGDWYADYIARLFYIKINGYYSYIQADPKFPQPLDIVDEGEVNETYYWSNLTLNLQAGDDFEIPYNWLVICDISPPALGVVIVRGVLQFNEEIDIVFSFIKMWIRGKVILGNATNPYTGRITFNILGTNDRQDTFTGLPYIQATKSILVTGTLSIYGSYSGTSAAKLVATAIAGSNNITVAPVKNWKVNDTIALAPSGYAYDQTEVRTITSISGNMLILDSPLAYDHYATGSPIITNDTQNSVLDIDADIAHLSRNIVIQGVVNENEEGGWLSFFSLTNNSRSIVIIGVEFRNMGQRVLKNPGLSISYTLPLHTVLITKCSLYSSKFISLQIDSGESINITDNVFIKAIGNSIRINSGKNITLKSNLVIETARTSQENIHDLNYNTTTAIYIQAVEGSNITDNKVVGSEHLGYYLPGDVCDNIGSLTQPNIITNNSAKSGRVGFFIVKDKLNPQSKCLNFTGIKAYQFSEYGVISNAPVSTIQASRIIVSDCKVGINIFTGSEKLNLSTIQITNSTIIGLSKVCPNTTCYPNKEECSNLIGLQLPLAFIAQVTYFNKWNNWTVFNAEAILTDLRFINFDHYDECKSNFAISSNPDASDSSPIIKFQNISFVNVSHNASIYLHNPNPSWANINQCGDWPCTGLENILIKVTNSSPNFNASVIVPNNPGIITPRFCNFSSSRNAYECNNTNWGVLAFENLDSDSYTRIYSPVNISNSRGFNNSLNAMMNHDFIWNSINQTIDRLARFSSNIQTRRAYLVNFTGTIPNKQKFQLQGASPNDYVILEIQYSSTQIPKIEYANGTKIAQKYLGPNDTDDDSTNSDYVNMTLSETERDPDTDDTDPIFTTNDLQTCGKYYWKPSSRKIRFVLTGESDCIVVAKVTNSLSVSLRYDIPIADFFTKGGSTLFIDKVASILGIKSFSIRIVSIKSGSTIIIFVIDDPTPDSTSSSSSSSSNTNALANLQQINQTIVSAIQDGSLIMFNATILSYSSAIIVPSDPSLNPIINVNNPNSNPNPNQPGSLISPQNNGSEQSSNQNFTVVIYLSIAIGILIAIIFLTWLIFTILRKHPLRKHAKVMSFSGPKNSEELALSYHTAPSTERKMVNEEATPHIMNIDLKKPRKRNDTILDASSPTSPTINEVIIFNIKRKSDQLDDYESHPTASNVEFNLPNQAN